MGSEEFVEEFNLMLKERALLYINADVGFSGNEYFRAGASPVMHDLIWEITQVISFEFLLKIFELKPGMGMGWDGTVPWDNEVGIAFNHKAVVPILVPCPGKNIKFLLETPIFLLFYLVSSGPQ